ncbi:UNVERIFIED_CONTAM: hypothetical protein RMT77_012999 [Armadillidium vulgare]
MDINIMWNCLIVVLISILMVKVTESACSEGYESVQGDCYRFYNTESLNYADSQALCAGDDAHLVYIPDCNKFSYIITHLRSHNLPPEGSGYWIGATDEDEEGNWVWGNGFAVRMGVPFWGTSGANWDVEPNGGPNENCAQLSSSDQYYFHDEDCQGTGSPLCQKDPVQETGQYPESRPESSEKGVYSDDAYCPENFTYIGKSCFYFGIDMTKQTFDDSSAFCQSINAELPVLRDCLEFQELVEEIENNYPLELNESYWVGALESGTEGNWVWISDFSNAELGSPFWGSTNGIAEPSGGENQNCAMLYKNDRYYFHDGECNKGTKILCQTTPLAISKTNWYP